MQHIKTFILILICLIFFSACDTREASETDSNNLSKRQVFSSIFEGCWCESDYILDLQKTKSPYDSQNKLAEIVELDIDTMDMKGDSLEILAPSIHEGGSFIVYLKSGLTTSSFPTNIVDYNEKKNFYELGYTIISKDTNLVIYHYNQNKKLIDQTNFLKVPRNTEGAVQYMVNKTLIAGTYKNMDTSNQIKEMYFSRNGIVKGLTGYATYYVSTDFSRPFNNLNQIGFARESENPLWLVFSINGDTLNLYESKENEDHVTLERGTLKLKLLKRFQ